MHTVQDKVPIQDSSRPTLAHFFTRHPRHPKSWKLPGVMGGDPWKGREPELLGLQDVQIVRNEVMNQ